MNTNAIGLTDQQHWVLFYLDKTSDSVVKISRLGIRIFPIACSVCLLGWGAKVLLIDTIGPRNTPVISTGGGFLQRLKNSITWFFESIRLYSTSAQERRQRVLHGALFFGCGLTGIASQLNIGGFAPILQMGSNVMFVLANVVSLELNIRKYFAASEMLKNKIADQEYAYAQRQSAYYGILNNLGYIFCATLMLFGQSTAIALIVGCFGCFFGCLKILFDLHKC